jgi:hypothetical protein
MQPSSEQDEVVFKESPDNNFSNSELAIENGSMPNFILRSFLQLD